MPVWLSEILNRKLRKLESHWLLYLPTGTMVGAMVSWAMAKTPLHLSLVNQGLLKTTHGR